MSDARTWLDEALIEYQSTANLPVTDWPRTTRLMRDALLAVLNECDRWDNQWIIANWSVAGQLSPPTAPIRAAINKALGVTDE